MDCPLPPLPRFLPGFFPFVSWDGCADFGQSRSKCLNSLQRWHRSLLDAAIAAPLPETAGPAGLRDCWFTKKRLAVS